MNFLRISTLTMFVVGAIAIIGGLTEFGELAVLLGILMIISATVKLVALRIMANDGRLPGGARRND
ncbi:MAG: hypothetical protein IT334_02080 [Thermomicrobiales bacterium]|nr:hypothetical protein [Thermomicrobiales bacterium]